MATYGTTKLFTSTDFQLYIYIERVDEFFFCKPLDKLTLITDLNNVVAMNKRKQQASVSIAC